MRLLKSNPAAVREAAEALRAGQLVAFPTETVYGLGADALNPRAVERIFRAKGRPSSHPLIVHVASLAAAKALTAEWPDSAQALASAFWPGPLTLVLRRADSVPDAVTGGQDTVGLRWPAQPTAQALLAAFAAVGSGAVAAPSANRFGGAPRWPSMCSRLWRADSRKGMSSSMMVPAMWASRARLWTARSTPPEFSGPVGCLERRSRPF